MASRGPQTAQTDHHCGCIPRSRRASLLCCQPCGPASVAEHAAHRSHVSCADMPSCASTQSALHARSEGGEPPAGAPRAPFLQHAEVPGSLAYQRGAQLPLKPERTTPEPAPPTRFPPAVPPVPSRSPPPRYVPPPVTSGAPGVSRLTGGGSAAPLPYAAPLHRAPTPVGVGPPGGESGSGRTVGGVHDGAARPAKLGPAAAEKDAENGSGTDTDEDGELIAKARQKAAAERQRATAVVGKKRGPGTGACPPYCVCVC